GRDFARSVIESVPLPLAVVDAELRIRSVNEAFRQLAGTGKQALEKRMLVDLTTAVWDLDEPLRSHLNDLRDGADPERNFEFEHRTTGGNGKVFNVCVRSLKPDGDRFLLVTLEDITAHREAERLLSLEREQLAGEVAFTARELGRTQNELRALAGSL